MSESREGGGVGEQRDPQSDDLRGRVDGAPAVSQKEPAGPDPLIGRVINDRFKILSVLARGGMGKVYKAEQAPLGRLCALKVLSPKYEGDRDPEFHKRFFLEAATAAKLTHANTVTIFDYGKAEGEEIYYIAMELVEGKTLHKVLREQGPFADERARHIASQICRSLREAHGMGVVHRDLKPGNIMLSDKGDERDNVKVLDFGLVKDVTGEAEDLTQAGLFMGSPKYMAPEQILGHEITPRTDIYSLGVMLFEMLVGKVPFDKGASVGTLMSHVNDPVPSMTAMNPNAKVTPATEAIIRRCLEKDPNKRYASMKDVLHALKTAGGDSSTDTFEGMPLPVVPKDRPSNSGPVSGPISAPIIARAPGSDTEITAVPSHVRSNAPPQDSSLFSHAREKPRSKALLWALLVAAAAGAAVVVVMQKRAPSTNGDAAIPTASVVVPPPAASASAPPPIDSSSAEPAGPRTVHVESEPAGASVSEAGTELCPSTPCDVIFKGDAAEHKLSLSKKGYKPAKVSLGPNDQKVTAKLDVYLGGAAIKKPENNGPYKPDPYK